MHLGGARVSTDAQDLTNQCIELAASGCTKLFSEKLTGAQPCRVMGRYHPLGRPHSIAFNRVVAILLAHSSETFALGKSGGWTIELQALLLRVWL